jgi:hypothetical protein
MFLSDYYDVLGLPLCASLDEIRKKYNKLSRKYHPDKNDGDQIKNAKFTRIEEAYEALIEFLQWKCDEQERHEREKYEKELHEYETPPDRENPEGEERREREDHERKRKADELFLKQNEDKIKAYTQFMVERQESCRAFMTTELQKICANHVRHHTDADGLEWYSVLDFIRQVCPGKTMKAVYRSWDNMKLNEKITPFIKTTNRYTGNNSMPETTPAVTLWGLQLILTMLTEKQIGQEFHILLKVASCF